MSKLVKIRFEGYVVGVGEDSIQTLPADLVNFNHVRLGQWRYKKELLPEITSAYLGGRKVHLTCNYNYGKLFERLYLGTLVDIESTLLDVIVEEV